MHAELSRLIALPGHADRVVIDLPSGSAAARSRRRHAGRRLGMSGCAPSPYPGLLPREDAP
ncbi:MAG: hypothetical protein WAL50_14220 [Kineosporiaceae bacterium]